MVVLTSEYGVLTSTCSSICNSLAACRGIGGPSTSLSQWSVNCCATCWALSFSVSVGRNSCTCLFRSCSGSCSIVFKMATEMPPSMADMDYQHCFAYSFGSALQTEKYSTPIVTVYTRGGSEKRGFENGHNIRSTTRATSWGTVASVIDRSDSTGLGISFMRLLNPFLNTRPYNGFIHQMPHLYCCNPPFRE